MNKLTKILMASLMLAFLVLSTVSFASALVIDSVSLVDEITPGSTSRVIIALKNDGSEDVEDVSVSLDLANVPFAPYDSASEYSIDKIRENKIKDAFFEIIALNNAKSGIYKIPVTISYLDTEDDEIKTKSSLISIIVNSKPIIDVNIEDSLLLKGKDNEIIIKVTNKGLSDAKFVEVMIGKSTYINVLSSEKSYIGDIDSDDFDSIKINAFFSKDTSDNVKLPVKVIYFDDLNNRYEEDFDVSLKVYTSKKAIELGLMERNNTPFIAIGIVFIVVLYFVYRYLRKRLKNRSK